MQTRYAVILLAFLITACRSHPVAIAPIAEHTPAEFEIPEARKTDSAAPPTARPAASPDDHAVSSACPAAKWRRLPNTAFPDTESWRFDVRWAFLKAGEATLKVEGIETVRDRPAYHVTMDIQATGATGSVHPFRDRTDAWLDKESLTTRMYRHSVRESTYQADEVIVFDAACGRFHKRYHRLDKEELETREGLIPSDTLDMFGTLYYLRTLPLASGQTIQLSLFTGNKVVPVTAQIGKKEHLKVSAGSFECYPIEMHATDPSVVKKVQQIRWWVSIDERHIPVRIRMNIPVGHMTADLQKS